MRPPLPVTAEQEICKSERMRLTLSLKALWSPSTMSLSPAILVGHSYGGSVITAAGTDSRVAALVFIAALAPDADETTQSQLDKYPKTDILAHVEVADGRVWVRPDGVASFAGDLPEQEQRFSERAHGLLRINTGYVPYAALIQAHLAAFGERYPEITLDITLDNNLSDIVAGGFDAGIRWATRCNVT